MLVIGSILAIILTGAYIFLGMKIAESIVQPDVKIFFWGLYSVTLLTLINVSLSVFFYSKIAQKQGPLGPRGIKGSLGEKGDPGNCTENNTCKVKTVQVLLEEVIQDYKNESDITPLERKKICNIVNHTINKNSIKNWGLGDLQNYRDNIKSPNNFTSIENKSLEERITEQNNGIDNLGWLENLIRSNAGSGNLIDPNNESQTECV